MLVFFDTGTDFFICSQLISDHCPILNLSSDFVCLFGWLCGLCDLDNSDCHVLPSYLLHHRFTLDKLYPYFLLASLLPFLNAYFTTACLFLASCDTMFMRSNFLSGICFVVNSLYHIFEATSLFIGSHHFNTYIK